MALLVLVFYLLKSNKKLSVEKNNLDRSLLELPRLKEDIETLKSEKERTKDYDVKVSEIDNLKVRLEEKDTAYQKLEIEKNEVLKKQDEELNVLRRKAEDLAGANTRIEELNLNIRNKEKDIASLNEKIQKIQDDNTRLRTDFSELQERASNAKKYADDKEREFLKKQEQMEKDLQMNFENLSNKVLEKQTKTFKEGSNETLITTLQPFKEQVERYEKALGEFKESNSNQIQKFIEASVNLSTEAQELSNALRHDSKKQGNWGEGIIEDLLVSMGYVKGETFFTQYSFKNIDPEVKRKNLQPDFIVKLSNEKCIIVDSKVSLTAHTNFVNAKNDDDKKKFLKDHLTSVKDHVAELAKYINVEIEGMETPEFVIMCMPNENAYFDAVNAEPDLIKQAIEQKVSIVTPSSLVPALRVGAYIWNLEKQYQNIDNIRNEFKLAYKRLNTFLENFDKLEDGIEKVDSAISALKRSIDGTQGLKKSLDKLTDDYNFEKIKKIKGSKGKKNKGEEILSIEDQRDIEDAEFFETTEENESDVEIGENVE